MLVVADVLVMDRPPCRRCARSAQSQMLTDFQVALRRDAAFVPASMDRRPDTMLVVSRPKG